MPDKITKFINSLEHKLQERVLRKLKELKENPRALSGVKKMKGEKTNRYRLRIGKIRVVYEMLNNEIEVIDIDWRGNIY